MPDDDEDRPEGHEHLGKHAVAKGSLRSIDFRTKKYLGPLRDLVLKTNKITTHAYQLAKFIMLHECHSNVVLPELTGRPFLEETFLALTSTPPERSYLDRTKEYRALIAKHMPAYLRASGFTPVDLPDARQIAAYEATRMSATYRNNVKQHYGDHLRGTVNLIMRVKERKAALEATLQQQGRSRAQINEVISDQVTGPAREVKLALGALSPTIRDHDANFPGLAALMDHLAGAYPPDPTFMEDSVYFESKARPERHIKAMLLLAQFREARGFKAFQALPVRHGWVPGYITLDTRIAARHLLNWDLNPTGRDHRRVWSKLVNLKRRIFRRQGDCAFHWVIQTDGVAVSVIKQNDNDLRSFWHRPHVKAKVPPEYLEEQSRETLNSTKYVLIDPNMRDLLYCMHEDSEPDAPRIFRYTSNRLAKDSRRRKLRKIREAEKPDEVSALERTISGRKSSNAAGFTEYIRSRGRVEAELSAFYQQELWRKLRWSGHISQQRADEALFADLRKAFGTKVTLVIGDWSHPMMKFHEPLPGEGTVRKLRRAHFRVLRIGEYRTSTFCPDCHDRVQNFLQVPNPRPYRRATRPKVICWGLLRCNNQKCKQAIGGRSKYWNRDTLSVLNFRHILNSLRETGERAERFRRPSE